MLNGYEQSLCEPNLRLGGAALGQGVGNELDTYWLEVSEPWNVG